MTSRTVTALFLVASGILLRAEGQVLIDQEGYRPADQKVAFIRESGHATFEIVGEGSQTAAFQGTIATIGSADESTGDLLYALNFTQFRMPGKYRLRIPGTQLESPVFTIADDAYRRACLAALQSFYYQRCGTAVNNGTVWKHPPCHEEDAVYYDDPSRRKDMTGGWHDAGDYGKFLATGTESAAFLLYLYEAHPEEFTDRQAQIPESGNGVPDILDEARWELQWILKMQSEDGGVCHKVSSKKWTGEYLPDRDHDTRYIFPVSSAATASFAAITALGSRVYQKWDRQFSFDLLKAASAAWKYLEQHQGTRPAGGFRNPPGVEGGEYGDAQDGDERLWAAAELFRTTHNPAYHRYFLSNYERSASPPAPISWAQVGEFAVASYLRMPADETDFRARSFLVGALTNFCDGLLRRIELSGYRCVLTPDEYYWGSNSVAAGYAFDLVSAWETTKSPRYLHAALDQLHYLLGRNTFNTVFLTGAGAHAVQHPYHQFSMMLGAGDPVPGLLAGGPNKGSRLRGAVLSQFPGKCYEDNEKNYFVNEVAINYTAPFVFLSGYFAGAPAEQKTGSQASVK